MPGCVILTAAAGPHGVLGSISVDTLIVEAGAVVRVAPEAVIAVRYRLEARGTAEAPITFTAEDPARPWGGIIGHSWTCGLDVAHVLFEHATRGMSANGVWVSHSRFRQIEGPALTGSDCGMCAMRIIETVVDSACLGGGSCAAVEFEGKDSWIRFEESLIRDSGGAGLVVMTWGRGGMSLGLAGGAIEGSAGPGLVTLGEDVAVRTYPYSPLRITGGAAYPAHVDLTAAADHLATAERRALWTGNARDTVLVYSYFTSADSVTISADLPWRMTLKGGAPIGRLTLEPGAGLALEHPGHSAWPEKLIAGRVVSHGSPDAPIEIKMVRDSVEGSLAELWVTGTGPSRLVHTKVRGGRMVAEGEALVLDDVWMDSVDFRLAAPGSRLTRLRLTGAPLTIAAADVELAWCDVTGSPGAGILVQESEGVRIQSCNIHGAHGLGLENTAEGVVDARGNWWGDPAGPHGPNGSGVAGNVLYEPWLTEPVDLAASPALGEDAVARAVRSIQRP